MSRSRITLLTRGTIHRYIGATSQWITTVGGAKIPIVAIQRSTGLTIIDRIAGFNAVADVIVVTVAIVGVVHTVIKGGITGVVGTGDTIIAAWRCAGQTFPCGRVAGLRAVAEDAVVAVCIHRATRNTSGIVLVIEKVTVVIQASTAKILSRRCRR